jgi:hypothetical protein
MMIAPAPELEGTMFSRFLAGVRHPVRYVRDLTGDHPVYPLLILFGLNAASSPWWRSPRRSR